MKTIFKKFINQKGFGLVEVAVAIGILSVVSVGVMSVGLNSNKDKLRHDLGRVASKARQNFESNLKNAAAWNNTLAANPESFKCFTEKNCALNPGSPDGYYNFVLYGSKGEKLSFDKADPTSRIALYSEFCSKETPEKSELCPLIYIARWKPVCTTYPCANAQVQIEATMIHNFPEQAVFNPTVFNFKTVRSYIDNSTQTACLMLNGIYNTATGKCIPKYANKTCANEGYPYQTVTKVTADGNISCSPVYSGVCDPNTQLVTGHSGDGVATCSPRPANSSTCPINCVGGWGPVDTSIKEMGEPLGTGGMLICGQHTYYIFVNEANGGLTCPFTNGYKEFIGCTDPPIDCVGNWGACSASCGGGTQEYTITNPGSFGGASCEFADKATRTCNNQPCTGNSACVGAWGTCNPSTGLQSYTVISPATGSGAACPAATGTTRTCPVDCVGDWSSCKGTAPSMYKEFIHSVTAKNGGAACSTANGVTDLSDCNGGSCRKLTCFVAGTKISMADGTLKNIEDVKAGEKVLSFDERTKSQRIDVVERPLAHESQMQELHHFTMSDGAAVTSNDEHPFFVLEKDQWLRAFEINKLFKQGETITFLNKENKKIIVKNIRIEYKNVSVYNLSIKGIARHDIKYGDYGLGHSYYANGILTHNKWAMQDGVCDGGVEVAPGNCGIGCNLATEEYIYDGVWAKCCPKAKVDCVGSWGACGATTAGKEIFRITTPASGGGASCEATDGAYRNCGTICRCEDKYPFNGCTKAYWMNGGPIGSGCYYPAGPIGPLGQCAFYDTEHIGDGYVGGCPGTVPTVVSCTNRCESTLSYIKLEYSDGTIEDLQRGSCDCGMPMTTTCVPGPDAELCN